MAGPVQEGQNETDAKAVLLLSDVPSAPKVLGALWLSLSTVLFLVIKNDLPLTLRQHSTLYEDFYIHDLIGFSHLTAMRKARVGHFIIIKGFKKLFKIYRVLSGEKEVKHKPLALNCMAFLLFLIICPETHLLYHHLHSGSENSQAYVLFTISMF